jgi:hypothetical protein
MLSELWACQEGLFSKKPRPLQGRKERTHPERARSAGSLAQSQFILITERTKSM